MQNMFQEYLLSYSSGYLQPNIHSLHGLKAGRAGCDAYSMV